MLLVQIILNFFLEILKLIHIIFFLNTFSLRKIPDIQIAFATISTVTFYGMSQRLQNSRIH